MDLRRPTAMIVAGAWLALVAPAGAEAGSKPTPAQGLKPRPGAIVKPDWLAQNTGVTLFHVSWGGERDYRRAHIPGAIHFDTNRIERPPLWKLVSDADLEEALLGLGVRKASRVVLYGEPTMAATRAALALLYAGVDEVRVLDGGLEAWRAAGRPTERGTNRPVPVESFGAPIPGRPDLIVDAGKVRTMLGDRDAAIVSVRSLQEQLGEISGYPDLAARGRIRGDVWGGGGSDAHHMEEYQHPDGTFMNPETVSKRWARSGIVPRKHVVFYCGTGWRASLAFWDAWALGWPRISVYDPGWYEWSRDPANPVVTGPLNP
jgi:thiosulfate/3-mercaptopyruvate sulfurtransferase